jgi:hypothetical protein
MVPRRRAIPESRDIAGVGGKSQTTRAVQDRGHNGKLVIVALLTRLLPRDWDGRRLLQFLTGLALLALAFAAPIAPAAAPVAAAPVTAPVAVSRAVEAPAAAEQVSSAEARAAEQAQECPRRADRATAVAWPADHAAALAGVTPGTPDSRGPPLG